MIHYECAARRTIEQVTRGWDRYPMVDDQMEPKTRIRKSHQGRTARNAENLRAGEKKPQSSELERTKQSPRESEE